MDSKSFYSNKSKQTSEISIIKSNKSEQFMYSLQSSSYEGSGGFNKKKKMKIHCPVKALKDYQREDLEQAFRLLDTQNSGKIGLTDIKTIIRACGYEPGNDELRSIMMEFDSQNEGLFSMKDVFKIFLNKLDQKDQKEEIVRAFKFFDRDQKGGVSFQDLKNCAFELDENLHDEEIQEMMDEADADRDGLVSLNEFLKMLNRQEEDF